MTQSATNIPVYSHVDRALGVLERTVLFTSLGLMIFLAFLQVVLRNADLWGIETAGAILGNMLWVDSLLRHLVLWLALAGAIRATQRGSHLAIDIIGRLLSGFTLRLYRVIYCWISAAICVLVGYVCWLLVSMEMEFGTTAFRMFGLDVATYLAQFILPVGFGLIAFRFLLRSVGLILGVVEPSLHAEAAGQPVDEEDVDEGAVGGE